MPPKVPPLPHVRREPWLEWDRRATAAASYADAPEGLDTTEPALGVADENLLPPVGPPAPPDAASTGGRVAADDVRNRLGRVLLLLVGDVQAVGTPRAAAATALPAPAPPAPLAPLPLVPLPREPMEWWER